MGWGPTQGFTNLQEKCPPQSWVVPGAVPWTSQSTKFNPQASRRYPQVVGSGIQLIAALWFNPRKETQFSLVNMWYFLRSLLKVETLL